MSNARSDDYFSFMSERGKGAARNAAPRHPSAAPPTPAWDLVEFEPECQIEVTESVISDTMIQRIFKRFSSNTPAGSE